MSTKLFVGNSSNSMYNAAIRNNLSPNQRICAQRGSKFSQHFSSVHLNGRLFSLRACVRSRESKIFFSQLFSPIFDRTNEKQKTDFDGEKIYRLSNVHIDAVYLLSLSRLLISFLSLSISLLQTFFLSLYSFLAPHIHQVVLDSHTLSMLVHSNLPFLSVFLFFFFVFCQPYSLYSFFFHDGYSCHTLRLSLIIRSSLDPTNYCWTSNSIFVKTFSQSISIFHSLSVSSFSKGLFTQDKTDTDQTRQVLMSGRFPFLSQKYIVVAFNSIILDEYLLRQQLQPIIQNEQT